MHPTAHLMICVRPTAPPPLCSSSSSSSSSTTLSTELFAALFAALLAAPPAALFTALFPAHFTAPFAALHGTPQGPGGGGYPGSIFIFLSPSGISFVLLRVPAEVPNGRRPILPNASCACVRPRQRSLGSHNPEDDEPNSRDEASLPGSMACTLWRKKNGWILRRGHVDEASAACAMGGMLGKQLHSTRGVGLFEGLPWHASGRLGLTRQAGVPVRVPVPVRPWRWQKFETEGHYPRGTPSR